MNGNINLTVYNSKATQLAAERAELAAKKAEFATDNLIDPVPPGTQAAPAIIPDGPVDRNGKFEPEPGFYQGFPEVTADKRWYFYWNKISWSLIYTGELPKGETGTKGEDGIGIRVIGELPSINDLPSSLPTDAPGNAYTIKDLVYIWTELDGWVSKPFVLGDVGNFLIEQGAGSGKNITFFPGYNSIVEDVSASVISGGGNNLQRNMIGFTESVDVFAGDDSNKTFTTTYDTSNADDIDVWLVRADSVLINVTPFAALTHVDGKTQVYYPKDGHFVNDAGGTNEGTNPAVLSTQKIRLVRKTKNKILESNSSYSGIYGGYDNLQIGIMNHQIGAHLRITGGNHNTQLGGSYNVIESGTYHVQLGGSGHTITGLSGTGVAIIGGGQNTISGSNGWSIGGQKTILSGARSGSLGAWNSTNSGSDSTIGGQSINNKGGGSFVFGQNITNDGSWSNVFGFGNINYGNYSSVHGRDNNNAKDYSLVFGRYCVNRNAGSAMYSGGRIATNGDSQVSRMALKAKTTTEAPVYASGINGDQMISIADNSSNIVTVKAVAIDTVTGDTSCLELKFNVRRRANITSISGTPISVKTYNDPNASTWDITPNVSASSSMFRLNCLGEVSKDIKWTLGVEIIEVSY